MLMIQKRDSDFQYLETLTRNRVKRRQSGEFFVEGVRPINQARAHGWTINALVYSRDSRLSDWAEEVIRAAGAKRSYVLSAQLMEEISQKEEPSELIALVQTPPDDLNRIPVGPGLLAVVLDRPMLPGNIGTIIRSADALNASGLILTGHSADLYDPETIRATTGSFFSLPSVRLPSQKELMTWVERIRGACPGLQIVGTSAKATQLIWEVDLTRPTVLVVGNETHGLSEGYRAACDLMAKIPMHGSASSLNLASATSILLYEVERQRERAGWAHGG